MGYYGFAPYVPVAKRRAQAAREVEKLKKKGRAVAPVVVEGRKIAHSFWGKAWYDNLERYSDYENRLPRGRTYVRNGSIVDLQIERGGLRALVSGSEIYEVKIDISVAVKARWTAICKDCAGSIGSLVELLQGKLSKHVMERICRADDGLFPAPSEIKMSCSCPDWAGMCKHVAATLYGVGTRLDAAPELLFTLRGVDRVELISAAGDAATLTRIGATGARVLADDDVSALFGLEMAPAPKPPMKKAAKAREKAPAKSEMTGSGADRKTKSAGGKTKSAAKAPAKKTKSASAAPAKSAPLPVNAAKPKQAPRSRRGDEAHAGRNRAAKWIGAKGSKASR
jgi:uncharacterized Zn finger protein